MTQRPSREADRGNQENFVGEGRTEQRHWSYACATGEHMANAFCLAQGSLERGFDQAEAQRMNSSQARKTQ